MEREAAKGGERRRALTRAVFPAGEYHVPLHGAVAGPAGEPAAAEPGVAEPGVAEPGVAH